MQDLFSHAEIESFDVEEALDKQLGAQTLPFPGMDKSGAAICTFFLKNSCTKENLCPFRHVSGEKLTVCKHWLRGLCKKSDQCEFLHEYDLTKMPECFFFSKYNACNNKDCPFRHIDPESKIKDCPWYDRGFCRNGLACKHRHRRRVLCISFMNGFCLDGAKCQFAHPSFEIPLTDTMAQKLRQQGLLVCHFCGGIGHKQSICPRLSSSAYKSDALDGHPMLLPMGEPLADLAPRRPLSEVVCYKCGDRGHYANRCTKGHLAFLSKFNSQDHQDEQSR